MIEADLGAKIFATPPNYKIYGACLPQDRKTCPILLMV
jgi:hypothetical protein